MNQLSYNLASSSWDEEEILAMQSVINSRNFSMGERVKEFERAFANKFGSRYAVMSNSGSSANLLAMASMRYKSQQPSTERNEVIVPAVSWSTTYYPIHQLGYKLKFVDVSLETLNSTAETIRSAVDEHTVGIMAVNLLGNPSQLEEIRQIADQFELFMIEDNCESMGATVGHKQAGTFGDVGTFSMFFSHHISTMEGGMCLTDDEELAQIMISMRAHGWTRELPNNNFVHNKTGTKFDDHFRFVLPGYNVRPLEIEAAIGSAQLGKLDSIVQVRRDNAEKFRARFSQFSDTMKLQVETGKSSWFGFSFLLQGELAGRRPNVVEELSKFGIEMRPIVAGNFTKNPVLKHLAHAPLEIYPNADIVDQNGLFVGNHHFSLEKEFDSLQNAIESAISKGL